MLGRRSERDDVNEIERSFGEDDDYGEEEEELDFLTLIDFFVSAIDKFEASWRFLQSARCKITY